MESDQAMTTPNRIAVIDDHSLFLAGVERCLRMHPDLQIVATGKSAEEARQIAISERPDVLLLDIGIPGNGLEALRAIKREVPGVRVVMLTGSDNKEHIYEAMQSGAQGYILKGIDNEQLVEALRSIVGGAKLVCPSAAASIGSAPESDKHKPAAQSKASLNRREYQILELLGEGLSNREISIKTHLPTRTVKYLISSIFAKIKVRSRFEAALYYVRRH